MIKRILQFIVAIAIPILAFSFANARYLHVGWEFALHEVKSHWLQAVILLAVFIVLGLVIWLLRYRVSYVFVFFHALRRLTDYKAYLTSVVVIIVLAAALPYLTVRYKIFSEVYHQQTALAAVESGDMRTAYLSCQRYLSLYPQRRMDGGFPDPVCVPLLEFNDAMAQLGDYIREQQPITDKIGKVWVPAAPEARKQSLWILDAWSGRADNKGISPIPDGTGG
jgi:hypothetical protein